MFRKTKQAFGVHWWPKCENQREQITWILLSQFGVFSQLLTTWEGKQEMSHLKSGRREICWRVALLWLYDGVLKSVASFYRLESRAPLLLLVNEAELTNKSTKSVSIGLFTSTPNQPQKFYRQLNWGFVKILVTEKGGCIIPWMVQVQCGFSFFALRCGELSGTGWSGPEFESKVQKMPPNYN